MKKTVWEFSLIVLGVFLLSLSLNLFLIPNKISSGGISSIGTVLLYLYKIPVSITNIVFNAILFLAGYRFIGRTAILKTVLGIIMLSLFLELTDGLRPMTDDLMIVSLFGGALMGLSVGLIIRYGASTGGSDFAGMILHRFLPHVSIATLIMIVDSVIVLITGIAFRNITITFYSFLTLFVSAKAALFVLCYGDVARAIVVISEHHAKISDAIMHEFGRGTTGIYSRGMYSSEERLMLLCIVTPKELPQVVRLIRELDPHSFVIIGDSGTVLGEGFEK